jgi:hypothetical protein
MSSEGKQAVAIDWRFKFFQCTPQQQRLALPGLTHETRDRHRA